MTRPVGDPEQPATGGGGAGAEERAERIAGFLVRLTALLLRTSGEGTELIARQVADAGRALGAEVSVLLVMESATLSVAVPGAPGRTVIVRAVPEVAGLDRIAALKPLAADVCAGRAGPAEASARLERIEAAPAPYPRWLKFLGIVLFSLGFAPLTQPTWYELGTTLVPDPPAPAEPSPARP
ncbi:threonine/serine exporter family protein [Streptomyces griseus]|uniref:threonine/serine exporter family protein n=1 Tax=Streptomyces griseus TaxID=1911 RepID=UPI000A53C142|nr:threonine/serine exporter family protein [Streptomyces griseus]